MTNILSKTRKALMLAAVALSGGLAAQADSEGPNFGAIEANVKYDLTPYKFKAVSATFTPDATQQVKFTGELNWYTDESHSSEVTMTHVGYDNGGVYSINVVAGTTYYLYSNFLYGNASYMEVITEAAFEIESVTPAEGSTISSTNENIDLKLSEPVMSASATLTVVGETITLSPQIRNSVFVSIPVGETLRRLYENGSIVGGETLTLNVTCKNKEGKEVSASYGYVVAAKPVELVSKTLPEKVLSYMPVGDGSKIILNFSAPVKSVNNVVFMFGNRETQGAYYQESLPYTIEGSTITAELGGKSRRVAEMVTVLDPAYDSTVGVKFETILDEAGNPVSSPDAGSVGSFTFSFPYEEIEPADISSEYTLLGDNKVELYLANAANVITFDGILLNYVNYAYNEGTEVVVSDFTSEPETIGGAETGAMIITFTLPADCANQRDILVRLNNLQSKDGCDYTLQTMAHLNATENLTINPAEGWKVAVIPDGQEITVSCPDLPEAAYVNCVVRDLNPANPMEPLLLDPMIMHRNEEGKFVATTTRDTKIFRNHVYRVEISAWESESSYWNYGPVIAANSVIWFGDTEGFKPSPVAFDYVIPENGAELTGKEDVEWTVAFTDLARLNASINQGMGMTIPISDVQAAEDAQTLEVDGTVFADKWNFTIAASTIKTYDELTLSLTATDVDDMVVLGNEGLEAGSYMHVSYPVTYNDFALEVDPVDGAEVEALTEIRFSYDNKEFGQSYNGEEIKIYRNRNEYVCSMVVSDEAGYDDPANYACIARPYDFETWQNVTLPAGEYTVIVPRGFFVVGNQFDTKKNLRTVLHYTVKDSGEEEGGFNVVSVDPADGSTVNKLDNILITFNQPLLISWNASPTMTFVAPDGETKTADMSMYWEDVLDVPDDWNSDAHAVKFSDFSYTEAGEYTLVIPKKALMNGTSWDYIEKEFTFHWTVDPTTGISNVASDEAVNARRAGIYTLQGVQLAKEATAETINNLAPGIYVINGRKVAIR